MPPEQVGSELTLQGSEAEMIFGVSFEDELDCTIAESADAIVEDDRVYVSPHRQKTSLARGRSLRRCPFPVCKLPGLADRGWCGSIRPRKSLLLEIQ